jgi:hypothetical protein
MLSFRLPTSQKSVRALAVSLALASVSLLLALGNAEARAAAWSIQTTANASEAEHSALYDIACEPASTSACTAVGKQTSKGGTTSPYAQYWNGGTWANQSAATPEGSTAGELQADTCLSKTSCVAAGSYTTVKGTFSLVESWNGTSWSIQSTPNPEGASSTSLRGVSCKVITACVAVGSSVKSGKRTAVALFGKSGSWSLQTVPLPEGATASELTGVDCSSSTSCIAVGEYVVSGVNWAMAATWNGTEWTLHLPPKVSESKKSVLLDVSCSDGTHCTAVGGYNNKSNVQVSFVQRWNGTEWTVQTSPNPAGSSNTVLQNVSCVDRYSCVAVGDWLNAGTWQPMAQYWNNAGWSLDSAANPAGATFGLLEGVACRITCIGIGWYTDSGGKNKTLGETREIPSWTQQSVPSEGTLHRLQGVSCVSGPVCVAAGYERHAGPKTVARTFIWKGSSWSASGEPVPSGATLSELLDVSCSSSTECTAVGYYYDEKEVEKPFAARLASGSWTVQTVPLPAEVIRGRLEDVSCTSSTSCRAVGERGSTKSEGDGPLTVSWNGTSWSVQSNPAGNRILRSISCTSSTECLAVGTDSGTGVVVERWNGTSWSALADPGSAGLLYSVSCSGSSDCTVAGTGSDGHPFASHWNGTTWSQLPEAPRLSFTELAWFEDIYCTSSSACYGVGTYNLAPGISVLAASWNGSSWTLQDVPKPSSAVELNGVACLTSTSCEAVGSVSPEGSEAVAESFP